MVRSDSSRALRTELAKNYPVPAIANFLVLDKYYSLARTLHVTALKAVQQGDLVLSYKYLRNFVTLINDRIPQHNAYLSPTQVKNRLWGCRTVKTVMALLEEVVEKMDEEMDAKLGKQVKVVKVEDEDLIDVFDAPEAVPVPPSAAAQSLHPSAPPAPTNVARNQQWQHLNEAFAVLKEEEGSLLGDDEGDAASGGQRGEVDSEMKPTEEMYPSLVTPSSALKLNNDRFAGVTVPDIEILRSIEDIHRFYIPQPYVVTSELLVGTQLYLFQQLDFHVTFGSFLINLSPELQMARSAIEVNRCFYLHLGVATGIHPFVLQVAFRNAAANLLRTMENDDFRRDLINPIMEYAGLVDANSLLYLWPKEIAERYRLCLISGSEDAPMFSCFSTKSPAKPLQDIIMYNRQAHFTLLQPLGDAGSGGGSMTLSRLLLDAEQQGMVVQRHEIEKCSGPEEQFSVLKTVNRILGKY